MEALELEVREVGERVVAQVGQVMLEAPDEGTLRAMVFELLGSAPATAGRLPN